jgi:hypothetical protein
MEGKLLDTKQRELFRPMLNDIINKRHELVLLADAIDWLPDVETLKKIERWKFSQSMDRKSLHAVFLRNALF